jgi:hypothetical protein
VGAELLDVLDAEQRVVGVDGVGVVSRYPEEA